MNAVLEPEVHSCPECGQDTWGVYFPGNNGQVLHHCCTFCGWRGLA